MRHLRSHHGNDENGSDQNPFQHQDQRGRLIRQWMLSGNADVQNDQHNRLNADAAKNVADGNAQIVMQRGGNSNGDFRQVRRNRQQKQSAQRFT